MKNWKKFESTRRDQNTKRASSSHIQVEELADMVMKHMKFKEKEPTFAEDFNIPKMKIPDLSGEEKLNNVQYAQEQIRLGILEKITKNRRNFPPFQGKIPLISNQSTFREWFDLMNHYLTLNCTQPSYYLITEIIRTLKEGQLADRVCSGRIKKSLYTNWLEQRKWEFTTAMVIEKIRGDYDLEVGEHKQRLENTWSTLSFENIRPGETMEELFIRIRELVVSLSHYGVEKSFP